MSNLGIEGQRQPIRLYCGCYVRNQFWCTGGHKIDGILNLKKKHGEQRRNLGPLNFFNKSLGNA